MHIWDLPTCTYTICGSAIVPMWLQRVHQVVTWQPRGYMANTWLHGNHVETIALLQIAYVQVRKSQMCMCARPQIAYVHVMTAATYRATVGRHSRQPRAITYSPFPIPYSVQLTAMISRTDLFWGVGCVKFVATSKHLLQYIQGVSQSRKMVYKLTTSS